MESWVTIFIPMMVLFGVIGWIMVFIETYRHFPKMDSRQRIALSISNATGMIIIFIIIAYVFMYYYSGSMDLHT